MKVIMTSTLIQAAGEIEMAGPPPRNDWPSPKRPRGYPS